MKETVEYFDKNGYVVLSNSLTPQQCNQLVEHMFTLHKEGKLETLKAEKPEVFKAVYKAKFKKDYAE
jgi:hypothetical protein